MGGQLDGIFLAGSLPHEFIILIVTSLVVNKFISLSLSETRTDQRSFSEIRVVRVRAGSRGSGRVRSGPCSGI